MTALDRTHAYIPLDELAIRKKLTPELNRMLNMHIFASIDSTNHFLKNQPYQSGLTLCVSETQTSGRGRFARSWYSPLGENIYCSFAWRFNGDPANLSSLSLVVSLAVHAAIQQLKLQAISQDIVIKWPNDLLWHDKKLAGILIEMTCDNKGNTDVIIGIGLNVNTIADKNTPIDRPWCALRDIFNQHINRNTLLALLITELDQHLHNFLKYGFEAYHVAWQAHDYLFDRTITVLQPNGTLTGRAQGVDNAGYLLLMDEQGVMHRLSSGDTSLAQKYT